MGIVQNFSRRVRYNRLFSVRRKPADGVPVLYYHGVEEKPLQDPELQENQLPLAVFERQISFLKQRYRFITLAELHDIIRLGRDTDERLVALTFDDGYRNNRTIVAPLLQQYNIPFTVFISTDPIARQERFDVFVASAAILYTRQTSMRMPLTQQTWRIATRAERLRARAYVLEHVFKRLPRPAMKNAVAELAGMLSQSEWSECNARFVSEQVLTLEDVQAIIGMGGVIGSHGCDHTLLHAGQASADMAAQLRLSRQWIAEHVGACRFFSFPDGTEQTVSVQAWQELAQCGYDLGFVVLPQTASARYSPWLQPRIYAPQSMALFTFLLQRRWLFDARYRDFHRQLTAAHD